MKVEFINPFLSAAKNVIETMCMTEIIPEKPYVKQGNTTFGIVTGIIGMAGQNVTGNMCISFEEQCIVAIVNNMLGESYSKICPEITDAVGELTNMISSGAKKDLAEAGLNIDMATPLMIEGSGKEIKQLTQGNVIVIPFKTNAGKFVIETSLTERKLK